jgi:hypothetical protein
MHPDTPKKPQEDRPAASRQRATPDADMQPEDAGTAESQPAAASTPVQPAMKQQSKTEHESGSSR